MFEKGQKVIVISANGVAYEATVVAVAKDDSGRAAYKVAQGLGTQDQSGQWHRAEDVFIQERAEGQSAAKPGEEHPLWEGFLKSPS